MDPNANDASNQPAVDDGLTPNQPAGVNPTPPPPPQPQTITSPGQTFNPNPPSTADVLPPQPQPAPPPPADNFQQPVVPPPQPQAPTQYVPQPSPQQFSPQYGQPKSRKKLIIFIILGLLLFGLALYFFIFDKSEDNETDTIVNTEVSLNTPTTDESSLTSAERDFTRRTHLANIMASLEQRFANTSAYPTTEEFEQFIALYFIEGLIDPMTETAYTFGSTSSGVGSIGYSQNTVCSTVGTSTAVAEKAGSRNISVHTILENGNLYCLDNS